MVGRGFCFQPGAWELDGVWRGLEVSKDSEFGRHTCMGDRTAFPPRVGGSVQGVHTSTLYGLVTAWETIVSHAHCPS